MKLQSPLILTFLILLMSCSSDNDSQTNSSPTCQNPVNTVFNEKGNLVLVEFEENVFPVEWKLEKNSSSSGQGYYVWTGDQSLGTPGNGLIEFKLKISNPGKYRFLWNTAVTIGTNGTEHNDSWLKFSDADKFYGEKNGNKIYPKGSGLTPNPNGSSADGWFKIYRGGNDLDFKWQASTSDNDAHNIYVEFDNPGTYTMQVSARSSGHGIDKFLLYKEESYSFNEATTSSNFSEISCN